MVKYTTDHNEVYEPKDIEKVINLIGDIPTITKQKRGRSEKVVYYNVACAFDIETSSWKEGEVKYATMYCWQFGINGYCILGRTWSQFKTMMKKIRCALLDSGVRLVVYVHNLAYEYQWIKNILNFTDVFNIDVRKPIRAITKEGFEFRCSYALSGESLEKVGEHLTRYPINKLSNTVDYRLIRHSKTKLTKEEVNYAINDIKVVMSYIQEEIEREEGIHRIVMTKTGKVRRKLKTYCFGRGDDRVNFRNIMKRLVLTEDEYDLLKRCAGGGYVHCSAYNSGLTLTNVASFDLQSDYPAIMVFSDQFPITSPTHVGDVTCEEYERLVKKYACICDVEFYGLDLKADAYFAPLSVSHCEVEEHMEDNGRIVTAKHVKTQMTEKDWEVINSCYDFSSYKITNLMTFERGYLPTQIVECVLDLYETKTKLKGVKGKEEEYLMAKGDVNSIYGCLVTAIEKSYKNLEEYNKSFTRTVYYAWGVYISSIARNILFQLINECKDDFIYCDTDSGKIINYDKHMKFIEDYNKKVTLMCDKAMEHHGLDVKRTRPKGRQLGIWDFEGVYDEFKGLRAKAYIYRKGEEYCLTLSGVNKEKGIEYLKSLGDPIEKFNEEMIFPPHSTGKLTHTYIDNETSGTVTDYMGKETKFNEKSSIYMEDAGYNMNMENEYTQFILMLADGVLTR